MKDQIRGSLYQKNGYYYARAYYYENGTRKTKDQATRIAVDGGSKRKTSQNLRSAEQLLEKHLATFKVPEHDDKTQRTEQMLADTARIWLAHQRGSKAPGTIAGYTYCVNDITLYFETIRPTYTSKITSSDVERYLDWERMRRQPGYVGEYRIQPKYSDGSGIENTVHHRYTVLRSILQYAKRDDLIAKNVASKRDAWVSAPQPQRHEFPILSFEEANRMLMALESEQLWFQLCVRLGLHYGLRRSEIVGMRLSDIDWATNYILISNVTTQQTVDGKNIVSSKPFTKNRMTKKFPVLSEIDAVLTKLTLEHEKNRLLFGNAYDTQWDGYLVRYPDGKLVSPNALTNYFKKFLKRNRLKNVRFHDLRHSCASFLAAKNVDIRTIQEIMGHQQLSTTMIYTHTIIDRKSDALRQMSAQIEKPNEEVAEN